MPSLDEREVDTAGGSAPVRGTLEINDALSVHYDAPSSNQNVSFHQEDNDDNMDVDDEEDNNNNNNNEGDEQQAIILPNSIANVSPTPKKPPKSLLDASSKKKKGKPSTKNKKKTSKKKSGPATPPDNNRPSTSSKAAVATPSDSAEKAKKGSSKKKSEPQKPSVTIHSFFSKADPSAPKKSSKSTVLSGAAKLAAAKAAAKEAAAASTSDSADTKISSEESPTDMAAESTAADTVDNSNTTKAKAKKKAPAKKSKGKGKSTVGDNTTKSKKSTTSTKKKSAKVSGGAPSALVSDMSDDLLDGTAFYAVVVASRTHSASKRRNSRGGGVKKDDVIEVTASKENMEKEAYNVDTNKENNATEDSGKDESAVNEDQAFVQDILAADESEEVSADKNVLDNNMVIDAAEGSNDSFKPIDGNSFTMNENDGESNAFDTTALCNMDANSDVPSEEFNETRELFASPVKDSTPESMEVDDADSTTSGVMLVEMPGSLESDEKDLVGDINSSTAVGDSHDDMNVDKEDETPVPDETAADDSANKEADSDDDDATVAVDEEVMESNNISTEANENGETKDDLTETNEKEEESPKKDDEVVVVELPKESAFGESPVDTTVPEKPKSESVDDTSKKPAKSRKKKDPNAPKGAKYAKTFYTDVARKDVKAANPTASAKEINKILADNFKALSAEERAPYEAKAAADKERHKKEMAEYSSKMEDVETTSATPKASASVAPSSSSSSSKSPKKKATIDTKGMNIMASFKKQEALTPKRKSSTPKKNKTPSSTTMLMSKSPKPLSEENASRLREYTTLREKYVTRATEVGNRPTSDEFEEETLCLDGLSVDKESVELAEDGAFPDKLLNHLQLIVQGRSLPLSAMAKKALEELSPFITDARPLTIESVSSKIKLLAQRKSYLSGNPPSPSGKSTAPNLDCYENVEECYLWRWELSSIDLLPQKEAAKIKKARTMRKKLQGHHKSIINLITAIDKATTWLQSSASKTTAAATAAGEKLIAKVPTLEEKVLKYERDEETARLLKEAKAQKQKSKDDELAAKQEEKQRKTKEREEAKRKKIEEKELEKLKKKQEQDEADNKNKKRMMSWFTGGTKKKQKTSTTISSPKIVKQAASTSFDSDAFRKLIDSQDEHVCKNPFAKLSSQSRATRRRKTQTVRISVFVTVVPENAFAPRPYDEEKTIEVPNRYKFLGFHEDVRPPYRGTWSKKSSIITGRRFNGQDTKYLDYENDSELEWEEGDDEEGEDLADGDDGVDEEDDLQNEEDNDGWLAAEDDLGTEDDDDETRELRKKNRNGSSGKMRVLAPCMGGLPHDGMKDGDIQFIIEGFTPKGALDTLTSHAGSIITPDVSICLDAYPPSATKETKPTKKKEKKDSSKSPVRQNKDMTPEEKKIMVKFVHNSTHKSKDLLVSEMLNAHPTIANSRAHAMRELDVIADKTKNPHASGSLWVVKDSIIKALDMNKSHLKKAPKPEKETKVKDPNAPKRGSNAWNFYQSAMRSVVKAANPNVEAKEIQKLLSDNFKALSAEERAPYDAKAAADKERYQKEMAEYSSKVGGDASSTPKKAAIPSTSSSSKSPKKADMTKGMDIVASFKKQAANSPKPASASLSPKVDNGEAKKPSSASKKRKQPTVKSMAGLLNGFMNIKKQKQ